MIASICMWPMTCSNFVYSRAVIDTVPDVSDELITDMLGKAPRIDLAITPWSRRVSVPLTVGMLGFDASMDTEVCMILVLVSVIASGDVEPVSYSIDSGTVSINDVLTDTLLSVASGNGIDVLANNAASVLITSELMPILAPSKEGLLFSWTAFDSWFRFSGDSRALQTRIPSNHE